MNANYVENASEQRKKATSAFTEGGEKRGKFLELVTCEKK